MIQPPSWIRGLVHLGFMALAGCTHEPTKEDPLDSDGHDSPVGEGCDAPTWYADADGDGYGDPAAPVTACTQPEGTSDNPEDCDDDDPTVCPGAAEVCGDRVVNDCDGEAATATADCGIGGRSTWRART